MVTGPVLLDLEPSTDASTLRYVYVYRLAGTLRDLAAADAAARAGRAHVSHVGDAAIAVLYAWPPSAVLYVATTEGVATTISVAAALSSSRAPLEQAVERRDAQALERAVALVLEAAEAAGLGLLATGQRV